MKAKTVILLATLAMLTACSRQKPVIKEPDPVVQAPLLEPAPVVSKPLKDAPPPVVSPPAAVVPKPPPVSPMRKRVVALLERKSFRQAVELMSGRSHEGLEREYAQALHGLLEIGDDAFAQGDFLSAARAFKVVLDASEPLSRERAGRDQKQIRAKLETCLSRVMEQGLKEYRRGRLERAIRKWKAMLTVNPGHREAKRAIETASIQLQSLNDLKRR